MATIQVRIGEDCIKVLDAWRHDQESYSDAIRRMNRHLEKHGEEGV